jgi:hypothetical protein
MTRMHMGTLKFMTVWHELFFEYLGGNRDGLGEAMVVDIGRSQQHMHAASTHL